MLIRRSSTKIETWSKGKKGGKGAKKRKTFSVRQKCRYGELVGRSTGCLTFLLHGKKKIGVSKRLGDAFKGARQHSLAKGVAVKNVGKGAIMNIIRLEGKKNGQWGEVRALWNSRERSQPNKKTGRGKEQPGSNHTQITVTSKDEARTNATRIVRD